MKTKTINYLANEHGIKTLDEKEPRALLKKKNWRHNRLSISPFHWLLAC